LLCLLFCIEMSITKKYMRATVKSISFLHLHLPLKIPIRSITNFAMVQQTNSEHRQTKRYLVKAVASNGRISQLNSITMLSWIRYTG
jgi:hypothetical protein